MTTTNMFILVAASDHPTLDDWVTERARAEATRSGATLGEYLGREGVLGQRLPPDGCCHVFSASARAAWERAGADRPGYRPERAPEVTA